MAKTITATFTYPHLLTGGVGVPVQALGGFASGIVPPQPGFVNGSTASMLKLYGDINGDGNMVYVEYTCDPMATSAHRRGSPARQPVPQRDAVRPDHGQACADRRQVLLSNIEAEPGRRRLLHLHAEPAAGRGRRHVRARRGDHADRADAVKDPITNQYQTETKALLNVSPRNVFNVWQLASAGVTGRVQPTPPTVNALLP